MSSIASLGGRSMPRWASAVTGVATAFVLMAASGHYTSSEPVCGDSGGDYSQGYRNDYDYNLDSADAGGSCEGDFGNYSAEAGLAIDAISEEGECWDIKDALQNAYKFEWTGWNVGGGYFWNAADWDCRIGFHHDFMGSSFLWAHEGSHCEFETSEPAADYYAELCAGPNAPDPIDVKLRDNLENRRHNEPHPVDAKLREKLRIRKHND